MNDHVLQERRPAGAIPRQMTGAYGRRGPSIPAGMVRDTNGMRAAGGAIGVQPKLMVHQPGDRFEQEADHIAAQVMQMPATDTTVPLDVGDRTGVVIQMRCAACEQKERHIQAKVVPGSTVHVTPQLQRQIDSLRGGGDALPRSERAFMEPRFGYNFGHVRVHTGAMAAAAAGALNARAFTAGSDVVFGSNQYAPGTHEGRSLIAHELVHTIQQSGSGGSAAQAMRKVCAGCAEKKKDLYRTSPTSGALPGVQRVGATGVPTTVMRSSGAGGNAPLTEPGRKAPQMSHTPVTPSPVPPASAVATTTYRFRAAAVSYLSCAPCNPFTDDGQWGVTPPASEPTTSSSFRQSHVIEAELQTTDGQHIASGSGRLAGSWQTAGISHYCNKEGTAKVVSKAGPGSPKKIVKAGGIEGIEFTSSMYTRVGATVPATLPGVPCGYLGDSPLIPYIGNNFRVQLFADGTRDSAFLSATLFPSHNLYEDGILKRHNGAPVHPTKDFETWASSTGIPEAASRIGFKAMRYTCCSPWKSAVLCPSVCIGGISVAATLCAAFAATLALSDCPESCAPAGGGCSSLTESSNP